MAQHEKIKGVWVVITDQDVIVEANELNSLRTAVKLGGINKFVEYGVSVTADVSDETQPDPKKPVEPASEDTF